jgi:hypothetical protein
MRNRWRKFLVEVVDTLSLTVQPQVVRRDRGEAQTRQADEPVGVIGLPAIGLVTADKRPARLRDQ